MNLQIVRFPHPSIRAPSVRPRIPPTFGAHIHIRTTSKPRLRMKPRTNTQPMHVHAAAHADPHADADAAAHAYDPALAGRPSVTDRSRDLGNGRSMRHTDVADETSPSILIILLTNSADT